MEPVIWVISIQIWSKVLSTARSPALNLKLHACKPFRYVIRFVPLFHQMPMMIDSPQNNRTTWYPSLHYHKLPLRTVVSISEWQMARETSWYTSSNDTLDRHTIWSIYYEPTRKPHEINCQLCSQTKNQKLIGTWVGASYISGLLPWDVLSSSSTSSLLSWAKSNKIFN